MSKLNKSFSFLYKISSLFIFLLAIYFGSQYISSRTGQNQPTPSKATYDSNDLEVNSSHPHFWPVAGVNHVGKWMKLVPANGEITNLLVWSGPLNKLLSGDRFVVYHQFTNNPITKYGARKIEEWEEWNRSEFGSLRFGGRLAEPISPHFYLSWMNGWADVGSGSVAGTMYQDSNCTQLGIHYPGIKFGNKLEVWAKGTSNDGQYPQFEILINDVKVATYTVTSTLVKYSFEMYWKWQFTASEVKIRFINDAPGRDLFVDRIEIDGVKYQANDPQTYTSASGSSGYNNSNWLYSNGYFHFNHLEYSSLNNKSYGSNVCNSGWSYAVNGGTYIATYLRETFGPANTDYRIQRCNRDIPESSFLATNRICREAPYVARVDQRYGGGANNGCEAVVYAWGYQEVPSGTTLLGKPYDNANKSWKYWMRNGELVYAGYASINDLKIHAPRDNEFWINACGSTWNTARKTYYTGRYRLSPYDYIDDGTDNRPQSIYIGE